MKKYILIITLLISNMFSSEVITCGNVLSLNDNSEAKYELHKLAQQRAQRTAEDFMGKKIKVPFPLLFASINDTRKGELKDLIPTIEVFWCENSNYPLHSAYYSFYMNNKSCW